MSLKDKLDLSVTIASIPFWGIVIYYAYSQMMPRAQFGVLFLGGMLLIYLLSEYTEELEKDTYYEQILMILSALVVIFTTGYMYMNFNVLNVSRTGYALEYEYAIAIAFALAMIYLTWRSFGLTFLVVVLAGIGYGLFGDLVPGVFGHGGISPRRVLRILVLDLEGFYGSLNQLIAAWVALFLLYAGMLRGYGAFDLILRVAVRSAKYLSSGVAQTAVIASAVIGSVNGSQTANAGMTGSFTIPMMKENGMRKESAAGIEAVASTVGQVLPPVMGAAAFIMASLVTGISYVDVLVAGLAPAFIMLVCIAVAVHYTAAPQLDTDNVQSIVEGTLTKTEVIFESVKFAVPILLLIYYLGIAQYTVMTSALYTVITMFIMAYLMSVLSVVYDNRDFSAVGAEIRSTTEETIDGARHGAVILAPIAIIIAAINGVVDILEASAVPTSISLALMDLSGGVLLIAAILGVIICILLGLGMPTSAAYTIVALLIAPAFINQFFVPEMAAHFFVFYAAILAGITPPIATAVAVAAGVAEADFWGSAFEAIKIAAPLFILPFSFIYHPEIVSGEFHASMLATTVIILFGGIGIIHGVNYRFSLNRIGRYSFRWLFFVFGIVAMVYPSMMIQLGACALIIAMLALQNMKVVTEFKPIAQ
ncbi:TRAP transporter permease [Natronorubrum sp. FCH18a]|uniref:TRAP transporter permease n=1 Tax=Natronorubrum sp. FCH18a TaxID=3447018 RepID=UPI003F512C84